MELVEVTAQDLPIDAPLPFAVYTASGKLLLAQGHYLQSESQRDRILSTRGYRADGPGNGRTATTSPVKAQLLISGARHDAPGTTGVTPNRPMTATLPAVLDAFKLALAAEPQASLKCEFVGAVAGEALIVTAQEGLELLEPGVDVDCQALRGRKVYRFRTTVLERCDSPVKVVYLAYPKSVQTHIVRGHTRVATDLPARLIRNDCVAAGFDATVVNVSLGGAGLRMSDALVAVGEHFKLALRLRAEGKLHAVVFNCVARSVRRVDSAVMIGAEFGSRSTDALSVLRALMFEMATGSGV